ncbi:class II fructose-bisphosphatase [Paracoccus sp. JM45]|uniref:class II fructose-bisphosphatase n=1 Tax=Paracoccus sp. JM45 TaxID=2283626 RepID=UPI000E6D0192|nr:class II fructose-bisphosphatase [Paracoccus sp. JM45]RJE79520.1 class II fructose-bisphosphatase [Paracoccus sp. JM45]
MTASKDFDDRLLSLGLARVSEAAAYAAASLIGRGNEHAADQAAVSAMHAALNQMDITGTIVIGEGDHDQTPMLYLGETLGTGDGPRVDIALDPLQGCTLTAKDMPNAMTVIALALRGSLMQVPDVYMDKLAIGPGYPPDLVTLDMSPAERVHTLAQARGCAASDITVCILERPRHEDIIAEVRDTGAAVRLLSDGDVAGVIHTAEPELTGIDMYMGSGGAPEGVLAACAMKCMGGQIWGRLIFRTKDDEARARQAGITDLNRIYGRDDMVTSDVIFAATGVTDGTIVAGVKREPGYLTTETILMRSKTGSVRRMTYRSPVK